MGAIVATGPADAVGNLPESVPADRTALADGMDGWPRCLVLKRLRAVMAMDASLAGHVFPEAKVR